ncbi:GNAT family N-acetyltransferase [Micromonospora sp. NPDC052213]|uniref:GNAT family N-acetyltransferase n=1 Tax=Micromonospora sp. NPDC052213 TaxID=3155812 RepID=UPI00344599D4
MLHENFPASYDHNKVILTAPVEPAEALAAVDRVLGGVGLGHRMVVADDLNGVACAPTFVDAGYQHAINLIMGHTGAAPDRPADPAIRVEQVDLDALRESTRYEWREQLPHASDEVVDQLVERRATLLHGADEVAFLAVRDVAGRVLSRADVYIDSAHRIAQIEDVMTSRAYTGRGYARAIMADGLRRAHAACCDLVFVVADAQDWPRHLYARLGYATVGRIHVFVRPTSKP